VVHQRQVDADPVREAKELEVPVVPPARVLLAEDDHEERRQEEEAGSAEGDLRTLALAVPYPASSAADRRREDEDRDRDDEPESGRKPIEVAVGVLDRVLQGILVARRLTVWLHLSNPPSGAPIGRRQS